MANKLVIDSKKALMSEMLRKLCSKNYGHNIKSPWYKVEQERLEHYELEEVQKGRHISRRKGVKDFNG